MFNIKFTAASHAEAITKLTQAREGLRPHLPQRVLETVTDHINALPNRPTITVEVSGTNEKDAVISVEQSPSQPSGEFYNADPNRPLYPIDRTYTQQNDPRRPYQPGGQYRTEAELEAERVRRNLPAQE